MAFHLYEDTWETTTTTGTGSFALGGAVTGWRAFSAQYVNADTCLYSAYDGANFEHGLGTYVSSGNLLARTAVYRSTNSNALVNFPGPTTQVVCSPLGVVFEKFLNPGTTGYQRQTGVNAWVNDANGQIGNTTATNDNAAAGYLGEYISSTVLTGSAVSLSSGSAADITTISLTAGDWDVSGVVVFKETSSTVLASAACWINNASATVPTPPNNGMYSLIQPNYGSAGGTGNIAAVPIASGRWSLSTTTTIYLSGVATWTTSTMTAFGFIGARRAR